MVKITKANVAKKLFMKSLEHSCGGTIELVCAEETHRFGQPGEGLDDGALHAVLAIHDERFFRRAILGGDVGVGESYVDGDWSTPDLVSLVRFGIRNLDRLESGNRLLSVFGRISDLLAHRRNRNTQAGSKKNIAYHYDLGNDFYRLFLDRSLAYSCAYYDTGEESLEAAQLRKFEIICQKLKLRSTDRVLEIGTGWGGFALYAAQNYGCKITTTTISRQQHEYAQELFSQSGLANDKTELLFEDYRTLRGQYDKIVSIEMFEAVGYEHYDDFFGACDRLLKADGSMLLQTITIQESRFERYRRQSDWIKKYIFPGAELASVTEIQRSLTRSTRMQMFHSEDIGIHYALTLREWRSRFMQNLDAVRRLGFDEPFIRLWDYYLAYCEAAFLERYISDVQLVLSKVTNRNSLMNEPSVDRASGRALQVSQPKTLSAIGNIP